MFKLVKKGGQGMAVYKKDALEFIKSIDELFDTLAMGIEVKEPIKKYVMGPAIKELEDMIIKTKAPTLYLIGRSGSGKSSLINAILSRSPYETNSDNPEIGHVKPTTCESKRYFFQFRDDGKIIAEWNLIDSRGLFESTPPEGCEHKSDKSVEETILEDLEEYSPDIVLHVIKAEDVRNHGKDFQTINEIFNEYGFNIPRIAVLSQVDKLNPPDQWPPEKYSEKAGNILNLIEYTAYEVLKFPKDKTIPVDPANSLSGLALHKNAITDTTEKFNVYAGVIPTSAYKNREWNIDTLADFVGGHLTTETLLNYAQALKRQWLLKKIANDIVKRFAHIAGGIGAIPIPLSDIMLLTPLQILLVGVIAGLSCRKVSQESIKELFSATALVGGAAYGLRTIAQQLVKMIPIGGSVISGAIAASGTYGIGKAAIAYFFDNLPKDKLSEEIDKYSKEWNENQKLD